MIISGTVNIELTLNELYLCAFEVATGRRHLKVRDLTISIDETQAERILFEIDQVMKQIMEIIHKAKKES